MRNAIALAGLLLAVAAGSFWWGRQSPASPKSPSLPISADAVPGPGGPLFWYDPMRPDQHFDKPGKSPFMDMQLVPRYVAAAATTVISIDPRILQNLGVRTAPVTNGVLSSPLRTTGSIAPDEGRIEVVQVRTAGWVERLHVRTANEAVTRGQLLAEIYSPELLAAQEELLLTRQSASAIDSSGQLAQSARQRLLLLGMGAEQIARVEQRGAAERRVAIHAPGAGVVAELGVREGSQVAPGMTLFRLVDLARVWVIAEIPEAQAAEVAAGQAATVTVAAAPGRTFTGAVDYVYPEVMAETRTLRARLVVDNPAGLLKPGMFAAVTLLARRSEPALLVPSEAVISTGTRHLVIVAEGQGKFRPAEVVVGAESDAQSEIRAGLTAGQAVVTSGQFLLDSEANLRGVLSRLESPSAAPAAARAPEMAP